MTIPDYETLMRPVLQCFADGATKVSDILPVLKARFDITDEEAEELIPSGRVTVLSNRAHWARTYLSKAGFLTSPKRNHHLVTEQGRQALLRFPDRIDNKVLKEVEDFTNWLDRSQAEGKSLAQAPLAGDNGASDSAKDRHQTPDELIAIAAAEMDAALASEVIDAVLELPSARFETLVIDLLIAMGYGGGDLERGLQTSLSGDGGIDGIINEDELGLDAVFIQAKRYAPDRKVGRPDLNAFVGSLTGEGASKGVFVTTSGFSKEAVNYVDRVQHRIVLIDGQKLARLMIKHEVGVRARRTYVVRSIDEDYFRSE